MKYLIASLLLFVNLLANSGIKDFDKNKVTQFTFLADKLKQNGPIMEGTGNVVVISSYYFMTAKRAIYDKKRGHITLLGNVVIFRDNKLQLRGKRADIDLKSNKLKIKPIKLMNSINGAWINSSNLKETEKNVYDFGEADTSICAANNTIWHFKSSSGNYDKNEEELTLWNTRWYVYSLPIFYIPYWSFYIGGERRSGITYPIVSFVKNDGVEYRQGYFYAPKDYYDVRIMPVVRTRRGVGVDTRYRYADYDNNNFEINLYYFKNNIDYQKRNPNIINNEYYGYDLNYNSQDIFFKRNSNITDKFYINMKEYNDAEAEGLGKGGSNNEPYTNSHLDYIAYNHNNFVGVDSVYYSNTVSEDGEDLQIFPSIRYHRFNSTFMKYFTYNIDYKFTNYKRFSIKDWKGGNMVEANKHEFSVPINLSFFTLQDYLNVDFEERVGLRHIFYNNHSYMDGVKEKDLKDYNFLTLSHKLTLTNDMSSSYDAFNHEIIFAPSIEVDSELDKKGNYRTNRDVFANEIENNKKVSLSLTQIFSSKENMPILKHNISEEIYDTSDRKFSDIVNEFTYYLYNNPNSYSINMYENLSYSNLYGALNQSYSSIDINNSDTSVSFGYFWLDNKMIFNKIENEAGMKNNFFILRAKKDLGSMLFYSGVEYDVHENRMDNFKIAGIFTKRCIEYELSLISRVKNINMRTKNNLKQDRENIVRLEIGLSSLLTSGYRYVYN